jgi:ABC-type taurine transport system ATPase subunit
VPASFVSFVGPRGSGKTTLLNLIPEIAYTGIKILELQSRLNFLIGGDGTEYGDKVNDWKVDFRARYFFR